MILSKNFKKYLIIFACLSIVFTFALSINQINTADASSPAQLSGYAWSPNVGWVSMSCENESTCGTSNYGVNMVSDGTMSGHAWSPNIGWISFQDSGGCPSGSCQAKLDKTTGLMNGWARAMSATTAQNGGWDGWIKLGGFVSPGIGVYVSNCTYDGYAFGGDDNGGDSSVIGWLSFAGPGYGVTGVTGTEGCITNTIATLGISDGTITAGQSIDLGWTSSNADSCTGSGFNTGGLTSGTVTITPASDGTYMLSCTNSITGDTKTDSVNVTLSAPPTVDTFTASPNPVLSGNPTTLDWSSTNAVSCTGSGFNTGGLANGSASVSPIANTTFGALCTDSNGVTDYKEVDVVVTPLPGATTVNFTAPLTSTVELVTGDPVTLTWSSTNATDCTGIGFSTSLLAGSVTLNPVADTTYTIECSNSISGDLATDSVTALFKPNIISFTASPGTITSGNSSILTWSSDADSCTGSGFNTGGLANGSASVSPIANTTFGALCTGSNGTTASDTVDVVVNQLPIITTFNVAPSTILQGEDVNITWSSINSISCTGVGEGFVGGVGTGGFRTVNPVTSGIMDYKLQCANTYGNSSQPVQTVTINVITPGVSTFTIAPDPVRKGNNVTIDILVTDVISCELFRDGTLIDSASGPTFDYTYSQSTAITARTTFSLSCVDALGGTHADSKTIEITPSFIEI